MGLLAIKASKKLVLRPLVTVNRIPELLRALRLSYTGSIVMTDAVRY